MGYKALNKVTIINKFPILAIDELLNELSRATIFAKLVLKLGYHQIMVVEKDVKKKQHFIPTMAITTL